MTVPEDNKVVVRRLIDEVLNGGRLDVIGELFTPGKAREAEKWIEPFRISFPDMHMEIVQLVAEADVVVGRFTCSATHVGEWRGAAATGRRFEDVDEVYFYRFESGRIAEVWGIEDSLSRIRQLGLPD